MKRRVFLGSAIAAAVASALFIRPRRQGGSHNDYFAALNKELQQHNQFKPSMIIDLDLVDQNIDNMLSILNPNAKHRIPVKSLPSVEFVRYFMQRANTKRLMVFHIPFLNIIAEHFPDSDVLFGKPMPVGAAKTYYNNVGVDSQFNASKQLQWLIDSHDRLLQYLELAKSVKQKIRINIEIDVGLHRGGLSEPEQLTPLLDTISDHSEYLEFSGFMGYDPHIVKLPSLVKTKEQAYKESQKIYQKFVDTALTHKLQPKQQHLCLNGSGSPTLAMHQDNTVCNDLTAGSCIVKPTDFDISTLDKMVPAAFIATPVLKKTKGVNLPGVGDMYGLVSAWNPNREQTFYIYGGAWMADYTSPPGLVDNPMMGYSTNQHQINGSKEIDLTPDDFVFLRPRQCEFVFLQFGDMCTVRNGKLNREVWPIFSETGYASTT